MKYEIQGEILYNFISLGIQGAKGTPLPRLCFQTTNNLIRQPPFHSLSCQPPHSLHLVKDTLLSWFKEMGLGNLFLLV